jgi:lipid-A-disaccharide synthase
MISQTIYFVAGEVSGDNHGAALMRALRQLRPDFQFRGRGGPQMKAIAGEHFHNWIGDAGVVGLWEVIKNYGYFRQKFRETLNEIENQKPDAVVLIDYPGFNLRLARALRRQARSRKIIYYISPQVWAWNRGRIKQMARWLDLMLCIFPFEAVLYNKSGLRTIFVGHPMIERLSAQKIDSSRDRDLIALFPGSRRREVRKIFPVMLRTAEKLLQAKPNLRFEVGAASHEVAREIEQSVNQFMPMPMTPHLNPLPSSSGEAKVRGMMQLQDRLEVKTDESAGIMQRAFTGIIASGSATQEAAYYRLPFVLVYKVSWLTYLAGRLVIKVDYLGMPNVIANKEIVPEFIQHEAKASAIVKAVVRLMDEPAARHEMISAFDEIASTLGEDGASNRAALAIIEEVSGEKS